MREKTQILFPVSLVPYETIRDWECFDADTGNDSAREIREYLIANFVRWKDDDAYSKELEQLIRDLRAKQRNPRTRPPSRGKGK